MENKHKKDTNILGYGLKVKDSLLRDRKLSTVL